MVCSKCVFKFSLASAICVAERLESLRNYIETARPFLNFFTNAYNIHALLL